MILEKKNRKARVFLAYQNAFVRHTLSALINRQKDMVVCGIAGAVEKARFQTNRLKPDLAVVESILEGTDILGWLEREHPCLPVLVIGMGNESIHSQLALKAGAKAYLSCQEAAPRVVGFLRRLMNLHSR